MKTTAITEALRIYKSLGGEVRSDSEYRFVRTRCGRNQLAMGEWSWCLEVRRKGQSMWSTLIGSSFPISAFRGKDAEKSTALEREVFPCE